MKIKLLLSALFLVSVSHMAEAQQNDKVGYIPYDSILNLMPEMTKVQLALKDDEVRSKGRSASKSQELERKAEAFRKSASSMTEQVRLKNEEDLRKVSEELAAIESEEKKSREKKVNELQAPIVDKLNNIISLVAAEHYYSHVISDLSEIPVGGTYIAEAKLFTDLVLKKLGL